MPAVYRGECPERGRPRGCATESRSGAALLLWILFPEADPLPASGGWRSLGPSSLGFLRAHTGKQYRRCGVLRKRAWDV